MMHLHRRGVTNMLLAILAFAVMVTVIVGIIDFFIAPILRELLLEQSKRNWCGLISHCANRTQQSLVEYLLAGSPWKGAIEASTWLRLKKAALLGTLIGVGWIGMQVFRQRSGN